MAESKPSVRNLFYTVENIADLAEEYKIVRTNNPRDLAPFKSEADAFITATAGFPEKLESMKVSYSQLPPDARDSQANHGVRLDWDNKTAAELVRMINTAKPHLEKLAAKDPTGQISIPDVVGRSSAKILSSSIPNMLKIEAEGVTRDPGAYRYLPIGKPKVSLDIDQGKPAPVLAGR